MGCLLSPIISLVTLPVRIAVGWLVGRFFKTLVSIALIPFRLLWSILRRSR